MFTGRALSFARHGDALEVLLHRDPCNELGTTALAELEWLVRHLQSDRGYRALILHSDRPRGFCAGADLRELHAGLLERREGRLGRVVGRMPGRVRSRVAVPLVRRELGRFIDRIHAVMDALDTLPILTIAVTHGVVFGGGFELALTADVIVAESNSRFAFPELRLGLIPGFGGIPRLERDVGNAVVRDLLLSGRSLGATRAYELGLVAHKVGRGKGLAVARSLAEQAARFDPAVTRRAKAFLKPLPAARLAAEKEAFLALVMEPGVFDALERFTEDEGPRPYLP
ncbi:MAG: enoyl-CoA hydratase/isomerase family protein [Alphaproteobacteria bacterium]|nr:enoyl-CoA hydratase/isomerase family protein [Alphaproteobacteria bacterium]